MYQVLIGERIMFTKAAHPIVLSIVVATLAGCASAPSGPPKIPTPAVQRPAAQPSTSNQPQPADTSTGQTQPVSGGTQPQEATSTVAAGSYVVVDTGQTTCYDAHTEIPCPAPGQPFYGQDAQTTGTQAAYVDNGDGTVTDLNTGLMWQQTPDLENKSTWEQALAGAETFDLAGYDDWRLPTIKELYSLIDFNGSSTLLIPYINTNYFDFRFGAGTADERTIDAQYWSSNKYVGETTFGGGTLVFGVNFADGRIKGYGLGGPGGRQMMEFVRYVRGPSTYGINDFVDNGDGTITDRATGLTWQQGDSGSTLDWEGALATCEALDLAGHHDWRLPNTKELQTIVDYTRIPAIDPVFSMTDPSSWFWTSTTLLEGRPDALGDQGIYIAFGRAYGIYNGERVDVHGAGAQRSDPKTGNPDDYPNGRGPQNDQIRIYNYARCVRGS